jgi:hypothetical protein
MVCIRGELLYPAEDVGCEMVWVSRAGCVPGGDDFGSKSEQYAESRPREGGVFSVLSRFCLLSLIATPSLSRSRAAAEMVTIRWRGPQYASESRELLVTSVAGSLCLPRENRFRIEVLLGAAGAGGAWARWTGAGGGLGEGTGV